MNEQQTLAAEGKSQLKSLHLNIKEAFAAGEDGHAMMHALSQGVDTLIVILWQRVAPETCKHIDLVAVGGYGRGELAPQSDWDLWFLIPEETTAQMNDDIQKLLYVLWDMNAKIGHAVRTVKDTILHLKEDWQSATAAMESRLLSGKGEIYAELKSKSTTFLARRKRKFVEAKLLEHKNRHQHTGDSAFIMEPDIKECKGGLRDVQSVFWITKVWYGVEHADNLVQHGFISAREMADLIAAQDFLWRCRVGIHLLNQRPSDRLSFEMQAQLAEAMGYQAIKHRPAVDALMKDYFRNAGIIARVSGLVLQDLDEQLHPKLWQITRTVDDNFTLKGNSVGLANPAIFQQDPLNLLRVFHFAQQDHRRLSSATLRQVREDSRLIDAEFCANPEAHALFLRILRHPRNVAWALKEMNDTAVLGRFIPAFGEIVGLGQFNQYHTYTVDEHTIRAVGEARNMKHGDRVKRLPLALEAFQRLKRPELLYLALIFHDIAKGMAGDHSVNGENMARDFCLTLGLNDEDAELVAWLVRQHLHMAVTSQRFDLSDPEVIRVFAESVGSAERLNYLLCLTVSDIAAVGPNVWNDWKGSLLSQLYHASKQMFANKSINPEIFESQRLARIESTAKISSNAKAITQLLNPWPQRCIAQFPPNQLLPIAEMLFQSGFMQHKTDMSVGFHIDHERCDTMLIVGANEQKGLFAKLTAVIAAGQINVIAAYAFELGNGKILDVFHVQDRQGKPLMVEDDLRRITSRIENMLRSESQLSPPKVAKIRQHILMGRVEVRVRPLPLASTKQTAIEVTAADRVGLLAQLAYAITNAGFDLRGAAISTFGERVVDVFFIQCEGKLLNDAQIATLSAELKNIATLKSKSPEEATV
ncbi:MAG: [protein-PII] uridylyltransferase [Zetaproteobacteria bacterium CG2_30_46_52]|nr:MAG: [protein-PII] uridylyltransferase [Zetaproteobacteria bacterium CG2_30_46_52]